MGADSRLVDDGFDIGIRKSWEDAMQSGAGMQVARLTAFRLEHPSTNMAVSAMSVLPKR